MGGSSGAPGGGYVPKNAKLRGSGSGGGGSDDDPCAFTIRTSLASPNPAIVGTLTAGNVLSIVLNQSGPTPLVEVQTSGGRIAGTVAGIPNLRALIGCLQLGVQYEFRIQSISGGRVDGVLRNI